MVYLVDFENVNSAGLSGIQKLTKEDKVYIFYTVNAASLSFTAHLNLLSCPAEVIYYYVASGTKNALDFQLASFLGYLISKGEEKNFCIISNDRGYEHVKNFWEKNGLASGISVSGAPSVNRALPLEKPFTARIQQTQNNEVPRLHNTVSGPKPAVPPPAVNNALPKQAPQMPAPASSGITKPAAVPAEPVSVPEKTAQPADIPQKPVQPVQKTETPAEPVPKKRGRPKAVKETAEAADPLPESLRALVQKANIQVDEKKISEIKELLKKSDGKQQFYRGLISIFGMENGVEVYRVLRPEYTNLTKLAKQ